jgi:hypothetical protein
MKNMSDDITKLKISMGQIEANITNIDKTISELKVTMEKYFENTDKKYAAKWVERAVYSGIAVVLTVVISVVLYNAVSAGQLKAKSVSQDQEIVVK